MSAVVSVVLMIVSYFVGSMDGKDTVGMMPEVVVTAPRYSGEDIVYSGMMPEIVVTAPRYAEEEAISGMMPEIVVRAVREPRSITDFLYSRFVRPETQMRSLVSMYCVYSDSSIPWLYN